jgi:uncharacterized protein YqhQ
MAECPKNKCVSVGGQALIEGIMMRGPERTTAAVRLPDGTIQTKDFEHKKNNKGIYRIPVVRGMFQFISSITTGYGALMYSAEATGEDLNEPETRFEKWLCDKLGKNVMKVVTGAAMVLGVCLAVGLFILLPAVLFNVLQWLTGGWLGDGWRSVFEGLFRILIMLIYMLSVAKMPEIHRVFQYHGAEHKAIFCYESGEALTVDNVRKFGRFHPRCGTSFLILMLLVGIVIGLFIPTTNPLLRTVIRILLLPLTMGIGYELIKLCGKYNNIFTRAIAAPGVWLQRITTQEPEDDMIEVAIRALQEVLPSENTEA